jgi:hypothetical protein
MTRAAPFGCVHKRPSAGCAACERGDAPWSFATNKAQAHLFSAAPELLSIAERLASGERLEACGEICSESPCLCCEARAAVAKAVGK